MDHKTDIRPSDGDEIAEVAACLKMLQEAKADGQTVACFFFPPDAMGAATATDLAGLVLRLVVSGFLEYAMQPMSIDTAIETAKSFLASETGSGELH